MIGKSPSGALSTYYYKGGYFHGIHYGDYADDEKSLFEIIEKEETFILKSPERKRILMDFYRTDFSERVTERVIEHIVALDGRIFKLAVACEKKSFKVLAHTLKKSGFTDFGRLYFSEDMEDAKTWLVSE